MHPTEYASQIHFSGEIAPLDFIKMQIAQVITFIAIVISGVVSAPNGIPPPPNEIPPPPSGIPVFLPPISYATQF